MWQFVKMSHPPTTADTYYYAHSRDMAAMVVRRLEQIMAVVAVLLELSFGIVAVTVKGCGSGCGAA